MSREIEFKDFLGDDAGTVEGVIEPKVGCQWRMRRGGDDAVLEDVCWLEAEYAHGFDAVILVCGKVGGGVGLVGDGAREDVGRAAASVRDVNERYFDLLEGAVEAEIEVRELADA